MAASIFQSEFRFPNLNFNDEIEISIFESKF